MQGIKYHSPKRHKKSLKHARLLVLQRFYFLRTVKDGIIIQTSVLVKPCRRKFLREAADRRSAMVQTQRKNGSLTVDYQEKCLQPLIFLHGSLTVSFQIHFAELQYAQGFKPSFFVKFNAFLCSVCSVIVL